MKLTGILAYAFWIPAILFLARYDLRTDDTGVEVFFLLTITFILGCLHPQRAWQWGLLVGPAIPLTELLFGRSQNFAGTMLLLVVVTALGLGGSYVGAGLRKAIS